MDMDFDNKKQPQREPEQSEQEPAQSVQEPAQYEQEPAQYEQEPESAVSDLSDPSDPSDSSSQVNDIESQDREWAKALSMEYNPPKPPPLPADSLTPPPIPQFNPARDYNPSTPPPTPQFQQAPSHNMSSRNQAPQFNQPMHGRNTPPSEPMPPSHMVWAIISILCCCLPLGVVAIIYASKVSPLYHQGDIEGARKASETTEKWIIAAIVAGVVSAILYIPISMLFGPTVQMPQL